jgi:hypothetical protein
LSDIGYNTIISFDLLLDLFLVQHIKAKRGQRLNLESAIHKITRGIIERGEVKLRGLLNE